MLRGRPRKVAYFSANAVVHDDLDEAASLKKSKYSSGIGEDHDKFNFAAANKLDVDYTKEIASGASTATT